MIPARSTTWEGVNRITQIVLVKPLSTTSWLAVNCVFKLRLQLVFEGCVAPLAQIKKPGTSRASRFSSVDHLQLKLLALSTSPVPL